MKQKVTFGITLLLIALILAVLPVNGEEQIYNDVIRLHVLAASDRAEDQANKLLVRDAVLRKYGSALSEYPTRDTAATAARRLLPDIERTATETLRAACVTDPVRVILTEEIYPRRDYATFSLPAGEYLSLRILIGDAAGQNWWCVIYPPLCLDTALEGDTALDDAEWGLLTENGNGHYTARFKILELLESLWK